MIDLSVTFAQELDGATRGPAEEDGLPSVRSLAWLVRAAQANSARSATAKWKPSTGGRAEIRLESR